MRYFIKSFFLIQKSRTQSTTNPSKNTSLNLLPLNSKGEISINNSNLEPILDPRPVSDSLYLHALFEDWQILNERIKLRELTGSFPKKLLLLVEVQNLNGEK